jgi:ABC-type multidrug transport system permease subunit
LHVTEGKIFELLGPNVIPMTYMNHALRGLITKGISLGGVLQDFIALLICASALMTAAVALFKKKLE